MEPRLQPIRVPSGWTVEVNSFFEVNPTPQTLADGFFNDSVMFFARHAHRRFAIEVTWSSESDPDGSFVLVVLYAPWKRDEHGRRDKQAEPEFDWANPTHRLEARSRSTLVAELEEWLQRCSNLVVEDN